MNFLWGQKNVIIPNEIQSKPVGKKMARIKNTSLTCILNNDMHYFCPAVFIHGIALGLEDKIICFHQWIAWIFLMGKSIQ